DTRLSGMWGSAPCDFDETTGTLTVNSGYISAYSSTPWKLGAIEATKIQKIKFIGNVIAPTDSSRLFYELRNLTEIEGLDVLDTSQVTNMRQMFQFCESLTSLDVSSFDTSHVTSMSSMFRDCESLTSIDVSNFDTSHVTDMSSMFANCESLTSIDVSNFDTSQATDMNGMFFHCKSLTSLDISSFDTNQVTDINSMFDGCDSLTSLDISSFDTSHVTSMSYMFNGCDSLTSLDLSSFDTSQVANMRQMFNGCKSLTSLDLSSFDTSQLMSMANMFGATDNLHELTLGSTSIFSTDVGLSEGGWVGKNTSVQYATTSDFLQGYDGSQPDTFVQCEFWGTAPWNFDEATGTLTVYSGELVTSSKSPWKQGAIENTKIQKIKFIGNVVAPKDSRELFEYLTNLTEIEGLNVLDTSQVTDMNRMFYGCLSLTSLDVSSFDTSQVTSMYAMFNGCQSLTSLDVSSFNTSQVTDMGRMFYNCRSLTGLSLSNFDTSKVTTMSNMFSGCDVLNELTLGEKSIFDTSVSLIEGRWTGKNTNVVYSDTNEFLTTYDGSQPDTFVRIDPSTLKYWGTAPYSFDESTGTLTIYSGNLGTYSESPWNTGNVDATKIQAIKLVGNIVAPKDSSYLFSSTFGLNYQLEKLVKIDGLNHLDTSQVTDMSYMFYECQALKSLDVNSFNTSQVTTMSNMFNDCLSLTSLDLSSFDTSQVTDMTAMFNLCLALTSLDVSSFDTKQVTTMFYMFNRCSSLTSLDLSSFDTSQVTNMSYMFQKCSSLTSLDLSSFNTSQVTDMSYMFNLCEALTSINVSSFNTSQVTDMSYMFNNCKALKSVDVNSFNTSQVTTMSNMFNICEALTSLDLSSFDTSQVTDMLSMFNRCVSLTSLDLSSFDTNQVTDMSYMFNRCEALTSLDVSSFDTNQVTDMSYMFSGCDVLNELTLGEKSTFDTSVSLIEGRWTGKNTNVVYSDTNEFMTTYDGSQPDTFVRRDPSTLKYWGTSPYTFDESTGTLTVESGTLDGYQGSPWNKGDVDPSKIQVIELVGNVVAPQDSSYLFSTPSDTNNELDELTKINGLNHLDTSQATDMSNMFSFCSNLTSIDVSSFNTSQVMNMSYMFFGCKALTSLNLSNFNTSQVTDMSYMFFGCQALPSLNLSNFNTSQVTNMTNMFNGCSSLTSIDVSSFTTSQVMNMSYMFSGCKALTSLNLSNFNTSQVMNMSYMFNECQALPSLDLSNFNTSQVTTMSNMFSDCSSLTSIDISSFDTNQVTSMEGMFDRCRALPSLDVSNFNTSEVKSMVNMFKDCESLTSLDVSNFDTSQVGNLRGMFAGCQTLPSLDLSSFTTSPAIIKSGMFTNCVNLSSITLGNGFNATGNWELGLPDNRWIGITNFVRFGSSADFINAYDGSQPDTYVWDRTVELGLATLNQDSMTIGQQDQLSWTIGHTAQSTQGRSAKALKGTLRTAETIDLADELIVEEQDALGNFVSIVNVPFVNEGTTNGVTTYSYSLSDLTYGHQYKLSVQGTPWNNTTISSDPTFTYDLAYDANLGFGNVEVPIPTTLTTTDDKRIENGTLAFNEVPTSLKFTTEKLNPKLNDKLISREATDWQIQIDDYRGTKAQAVDNPAVARQDWELFATAGAFKDSNGQEIAQNALNVVYVDEQKTVHELSETNETLLKSHEVSGETPKTDHDQRVDWSEEEGLQAIVHDRNAIEADETYQTDVTFELRSAP
ncbi:BspA family leucine-rich repeat surface protein, partial [Enterococcus casseliflavus]|nr:BspA family leucine-rich repeat surface protein [Enterococcus casseliflavus]